MVYSVLSWFFSCSMRKLGSKNSDTESSNLCSFIYEFDDLVEAIDLPVSQDFGTTEIIASFMVYCMFFMLQDWILFDEVYVCLVLSWVCILARSFFYIRLQYSCILKQFPGTVWQWDAIVTQGGIKTFTYLLPLLFLMC